MRDTLYIIVIACCVIVMVSKGMGLITPIIMANLSNGKVLQQAIQECEKDLPIGEKCMYNITTGLIEESK